MPAKKIIDAVGSTLAVIGSSIATAVAGPIPGSTPTAVPIVQPSNAQSRLTGVPAVRNPWRSWFQRSIMALARSQPPARGQPGQVDRQQLREHPVDRRGDREPDQRIDQPGARPQ